MDEIAGAFYKCARSMQFVLEKTSKIQSNFALRERRKTILCARCAFNNKQHQNNSGSSKKQQLLGILNYLIVIFFILSIDWQSMICIRMKLYSCPANTCIQLSPWPEEVGKINFAGQIQMHTYVKMKQNEAKRNQFD